MIFKELLNSKDNELGYKVYSPYGFSEPLDLWLPNMYGVSDIWSYAHVKYVKDLKLPIFSATSMLYHESVFTPNVALYDSWVVLPLDNVNSFLYLIKAHRYLFQPYGIRDGEYCFPNIKVVLKGKDNDFFSRLSIPQGQLYNVKDNSFSFTGREYIGDTLTYSDLESLDLEFSCLRISINDRHLRDMVTCVVEINVDKEKYFELKDARNKLQSRVFEDNLSNTSNVNSDGAYINYNESYSANGEQYAEFTMNQVRARVMDEVARRVMYGEENFVTPQEAGETLAMFARVANNANNIEEEDE